VIETREIPVIAGTSFSEAFTQSSGAQLRRHPRLDLAVLLVGRLIVLAERELWVSPQLLFALVRRVDGQLYRHQPVRRT
jgi:hypothetical protein